MSNQVLRYERPAVFMVNKLGDQLISLPAMRALSALYPGGLQLLLGQGMLSCFYRGLPVGEPVRVWWEDFENDIIDVTRILRATQSCDLFLCLTRHVASQAAELARKMGASLTIGYSAHFDVELSVSDEIHAFEKLFAAPRYLDPSLSFDEFCTPPIFSPAAERAAVNYVRAHCASWDRILFLHPETLPERMWPQEHIAWVLERFLADRPEYVVIVSSLAPVRYGALDGRVIHTDAHFELALAILRHADLFLGIDSCFLHAADLFRTPGIALFGPTPPCRWGFHLSPHGRNIAGQSMDKIRPERVLDALLELAARVESNSRPGRRASPYELPADVTMIGAPGSYNSDVHPQYCSHKLHATKQLRRF